MFATVAELLEHPQRWTKRAYARSHAGYTELPRSEDAACWCLVGACRCVYGEGTDACTAAIRALSNAVQKRQGKPIRSYLLIDQVVYFNDDPKTLHSDVLEVAREAGV